MSRIHDSLHSGLEISRKYAVNRCYSASFGTPMLFLASRLTRAMSPATLFPGSRNQRDRAKLELALAGQAPWGEPGLRLSLNA